MDVGDNGGKRYVCGCSYKDERGGMVHYVCDKMLHRICLHSARGKPCLQATAPAENRTSRKPPRGQPYLRKTAPVGQTY
jgi:hypothetical protein